MANVIIRLTIGSNARGPFNVYSGSTNDIPLISGASRFDLQKGEIVDLPGSVNGTEYIITIVDTFSEEYSEYVEKKVVVYDDEEEEQRLIRSNPEMTPTPSALSDYDLYLYRKCNSDNIDVEYKFLNIKRIFGNTDFLMFENECYEKEVGPLKANYKHPYIENNFYNSCNECYIERTKDFNEKSIAPPPTFYAVRAVKCCEEVHQGQTQLYYFNVNFSFFISNPFISPSPNNFLNYVFSYNGECYRILQAFNFTYAFFPNVTSNFFKKCSDCIGENGCATAYKAISCDESLNLQMIVQIDENLLNYWQGSNPPQLDNENVYVYEGICYQIIEPVNQTPTSQNIDVSDLVVPGIKCSMCDRPVFWSYGLKRCCATYNDGNIYYISGPQDHYTGEGIFWNGDCYTVINVIEDDLGFEFGGNQFFDDCDECEEEAPVHPCPTPTQTVTPSTTMTTPTPTPTLTFTPTNSLTASITPTATKTKFKVRIRRCCGPISATDLYIELNYGLGTLVPAVGHVIPYLGTCWRVMQINVGGGPEVFVPEVLVYVNDDPNTACEECILDGNYECGSLFFTGCTTGQLYRINGTGGNADYVPGQTYFFPAAPPFNTELSYETDYCFTNVIQTIQPNSSSYITLTYGGYPQYPQEVNCEDEQCVYVPPTPTPTVTITPTQSIMFIRLKKCCGGLNSFWRKVLLPNSYAVGDVIRMQNFINCHEIMQISFSFNPDFYEFANVQFHYSNGDSLENCAECVCDADPECNNPDLVCTPPVTETPAVTPSITPTQTRQRGIAVPCCEVDEDQYPNAISVIQFYVPLDAEIGDVIYYDIYPSQAQMVGNCFRIIDLLPMSEQYPGYPYTPTSNTITPQYSSGSGVQNCQNCIDDHPCPIEPSPTPTPTGTPVQTPTPSEVSVVLPPEPGSGGYGSCPEQPCLTFDQNLPRIEDAFLGRACCSHTDRRLRIMYLIDVPNTINVPGPNGDVPDGEKTYFKNMMTSGEWSTLLNFIGTNYTYLWNPEPSNPWFNQTDGYGYAQVASLPFIPVYDPQDVTYQESVDRVTYFPQYNSWVYYLTPVTELSTTFFSLVSQEGINPDYGFGPVNPETHTTAVDTILKERYGNNLPVGLLRVVGTLNSVKNLENWKLGGDQNEGTYDSLGNLTEHILSYPFIVDDLPEICEDSYWGIGETQFDPRIAKKIVLFIQDPNSYSGNSLTWGPNTHLTDENDVFVGTNKVNDPLFTWFQTRFIVEGMQSPFAGKLGNALDPVLGIEDPNDLPDDPTSSVVYHTEIIAVGIGEGSEWEHLEDLASYPDYVHRVSDIQQLNDPTFVENLNCQIQQNLCDRDRFGFLWLSGLTTGFIYEFNPETNFYNYYTDTIQEGPLGYFTIGDIVEGKTYVKNYGNPPGVSTTSPCGDIKKDRHFAVTQDNDLIENWETKYRVVSYKEIYETGKFNYHDWWRTQPIYRRTSCLGPVGTFLKIDYYFTKAYEYGYDCETPGCKYDIDPPTLPIPSGADTPQEYQSFSGTLKVRIDVAQDVVELANESGINILSQAIDCGELLKEVIENTPECNFDVEYEVILHTTNDLNGLDRFEYECWLIDTYGSIIDSGFHKGCVFTTQSPNPGVVGVATLPGFVCQMCCTSEFILELDIFESAFVHEMGHTFGLHHTFGCNRWKKEYPELEKDTLDNVLPFNSVSECLECGDYQPYFDETNGKAAIMSYFGYRVDMCGSVRNTFGPLDDDYVPELGYKYVVPTPAGNASTNDFIFDPYRTQNYVNIVGLDKKANITYNKFALDNEFQFGNPQIQSIQVNFKIIGNSNGMGNDFTNLTAKFINSSGGIYQFYTKGINQLNSGVVNTVSHTISSTANPYLSLFDYSDQEGFGVRFEHEFLDESQNNWTFIIRDLNMTFNFSDGSSINKKPKDYYNILEDSTGSYQMKATDTKMYSAERFTSYEGKIIQFYMDMNKNYFDYLN